LPSRRSIQQSHRWWEQRRDLLIGTRRSPGEIDMHIDVDNGDGEGIRWPNSRSIQNAVV